MSVVKAHNDGEQVMLPEKKQRLTDRECVRLRDAHLYADRLAGRSYDELARIYNISERHVRRTIQRMSPQLKASVRRVRKHGLQSA